MSELFLPALALMLVFEGILPFAAPHIWRDIFRKVLESSDQQIRLFGFFSMLAGLLLLVWAAA